MQKLKFIGLAGNATVGKDLFFSLLDQEYPSVRFSLGDILKTELREKLIEEKGLDIFNCSPEQKEEIRSYLVEYGTGKRKETSGRYFTDKLNIIINNTFFLSKIPVITDIRYCEYENDELQWLKNELNGVLVYIKKYKIINGEKEYVLPPNKDEMKNNPFLEKNADYVIDWEHLEAESAEERHALLKKHIKKFIDWYKNVL
tara:strand:+ start:2857 stop:3459 length:603 start_codon:yes stop_codon:yes gene_type:complete